MNVLVISPIYPSSFSAPNSTPLVHYYTRKWVEQGHNVRVIHVCCQYPKIYYWAGRHFNKFLSSKLGMAIADKSPWAYNETNEGVAVSHITMKKFIPHGRYSRAAVYKTVKYAEEILRSEKADVVVGHWVNPTLEVLYELKKRHKVTCGLVLHENAAQLIHYYKQDTKLLLDSIDIIGYRSKALKEDVEQKFGVRHSFMAYSGVPESFLETAAKEPDRSFKDIRNFVFVGALIQRKYPAEILPALLSAYGDDVFTMTYIGAGKQDVRIKQFAKEHDLENAVRLTGRIPRENIMEYLKKSDVFVMISKNEVYGLVYLEAMAFGCIPIAARGEGFDGIIIDGENGFLCDAGNVDELSLIIGKIRNLHMDELTRISTNAKETAMRFGDSNVAKQYLENVLESNISNK